MKLAEELVRSRDEVTGHQKVEWLERSPVCGESAACAVSAAAGGHCAACLCLKDELF